MSLDVLLEAADVLEKQKVASILTSMHEYDKNFTTGKSNIAMQQTALGQIGGNQQNQFRSMLDDIDEPGPSTLLISEDHHNINTRSLSPSYLSTRKRPPATASNYTILKRTCPGTPHDLDTKPSSHLHKNPIGELYTFSVDNDLPRSARSTNSQGSGDSWHTRSIHNQMEKNRRAQLRVYMGNLRDVIPSGPNRRKLTTLTLLQNARAYIQSLKEHEEEYEHDKQKLWRRHLRLRDFLCQLKGSTVLTIPGIPLNPGIRKFSVDMTDSSNSHESAYIEEEYSTVSDGAQGKGPLPSSSGGFNDARESGFHGDKGDTVSEMSDEDDSIGTFSNSDGGETANSPEKDTL